MLSVFKVIRWQAAIEQIQEMLQVTTLVHLTSIKKINSFVHAIPYS